MPEILGEYVDRIVTVEMRSDKRVRASGAKFPSRGYVYRLYDAARQKQRQPLTYLAAHSLLTNVQPSDSMFIVTGAGGPPLWPVGEVDGYLGAAAIARAMILGARAKVVFIGDERCWAPLQATCRGAGVNVIRADDPSMAQAAVFESLPLDHAGCQERANHLLDRYHPKAVLAIERLSPNKNEVIHGSSGISWDDVHAKAQYLFDRAGERGIATVGIGDGGNEIGFGVIADAVREIRPPGAKCQCPCGGGMAARVATDVLVVACISDWGGYGVAANIAFQLEKPRVMIEADTVERMLRNCVEAGAVDGSSCRPVLADDGVPLPAHRACIDLLNTLVHIALTESDDPGH